MGGDLLSLGLHLQALPASVLYECSAAGAGSSTSGRRHPPRGVFLSVGLSSLLAERIRARLSPPQEQLCEAVEAPPLPFPLSLLLSTLLCFASRDRERCSFDVRGGGHCGSGDSHREGLALCREIRVRAFVALFLAAQGHLTEALEQLTEAQSSEARAQSAFGD